MKDRIFIRHTSDQGTHGRHIWSMRTDPILSAPHPPISRIFPTHPFTAGTFTIQRIRHSRWLRKAAADKSLFLHPLGLRVHRDFLGDEVWPLVVSFSHKSPSPSEGSRPHNTRLNWLRGKPRHRWTRDLTDNTGDAFMARRCIRWVHLTRTKVYLISPNDRNSAFFGGDFRIIPNSMISTTINL